MIQENLFWRLDDFNRPPSRLPGDLNENTQDLASFKYVTLSCERLDAPWNLGDIASDPDLNIILSCGSSLLQRLEHAGLLENQEKASNGNISSDWLADIIDDNLDVMGFDESIAKINIELSHLLSKGEEYVSNLLDGSGWQIAVRSRVIGSTPDNTAKFYIFEWDHDLERGWIETESYNTF